MRILGTAPLVLLLAACPSKKSDSAGDDKSSSSGAPGRAAADPPVDKAAYLGTWAGDGVELTFGDDGVVSYKKSRGSASKSITGRFDGFDGANIKVNVLVTSMTLEVQQPPHQEGSAWVMTIEGARVTKQQGGATAATRSRRSAIEEAIRADFTRKTVLVKSVICPVEANSAEAFDCVLQTEAGDSFVVKCAAKDGGVKFEIPDVAVLDPKVIERIAEEAVEKKSGKRPEVRCPAGVLIKKVGATFQCTAKQGDTSWPATIKVQDKEGNVHIDL
jgi:hypothetical protein